MLKVVSSLYVAQSFTGMWLRYMSREEWGTCGSIDLNNDTNTLHNTHPNAHRNTHSVSNLSKCTSTAITIQYLTLSKINK